MNRNPIAKALRLKPQRIIPDKREAIKARVEQRETREGVGQSLD